MGQIRDIVNAADHSAQVTAEIKESLGLLMNLAEAKSKVFEGAIEQDLLTGKTIDSLNISITKVTARDIQLRAVTKSGTSAIIDEVKKSLSGLFDGEPKILDCIAGIVNTALTAIMGAGEGNESETRSYLVTADYPAIVRYDFAFWGRNIRAQSIKDYMENAFTTVAIKSAVDVNKLAFNDFLAVYGPVLRAAFGDDKSKLKDMIQQSKDIYDLLLSEKHIFKSENDVDSLLTMLPTISQPIFTITSQPAVEGDF